MLAFRNAVRASLIAVLAIGLVPVGVSAAYAPPIASSHVYWTSLNTPLAVAAPGLLDGYDGGGLATTVTATTPPAHGTLSPVVDPLGSFTYTPNLGFIGTDTFTYTITDPTSSAPQSSTATVTITVGTLVGLTFITPPDYLAVNRNGVCSAAGVFPGTFDFHGSGTLAPPSAVNPGGPTFNEQGTFTLDSSNGSLTNFQATFTISRTGQADIVGTKLATQGIGGYTGFCDSFGNFFLSEVHFVAETSYSTTAGPLVETGFASMTLVAANLRSGGTGTMWQGPFTLLPVAPGNTGIGGPVTVSPSPYVTVTFASVTQAGDTTVTTSPPSSPPPPPGYVISGGYYNVNTTAVFTTAVVCITDTGIPTYQPNAVLLHYNSPYWVDVTDPSINPVPHSGTTICSIPLNSLSPFAIASPLPVAIAQFYSTPLNTPLIVGPRQGLLIGDPAAVSIANISPPANGTLSFPSGCCDGSFTYTPNPGFIGTDTFTYTITDSATGLTSAPATVTITVGPTTVAPSGLTYSTNPAVYTVGTAITNNTPTSTGGPVSSYSISPALPAGLTFNTLTGVISGTPTAESSTTSYTVTAINSGGSTTATLTITVGPIVTAQDVELTLLNLGGFTSGHLGTYIIIVSNTGKVATSGTLKVTDMLPGGLIYVGSLSFGWNCGASGQAVTCTYAHPLPAHGITALALFVNVKALNGTVLTDTATVTPLDATPADNTASVTVTVKRS
jgi:hypothetical protein